MEKASGMNQLDPEGVLEQATIQPRRVHSQERLADSSRCKPTVLVMRASIQWFQ